MHRPSRTLALLLSFAASCGSADPAAVVARSGQGKADDPAADNIFLGDTDAPAADDPVCGDGLREGDEQCDDENLVNLDGCDATCRFEQDLRFTSLVFLSSSDELCPNNAFGGAFSALARNLLQTQVDQGIADGNVNYLLRFLDLDDLAGVEDEELNIGFFTGTPVAGAEYSGTSDLDWWYTADRTALDAARLPLVTVPARIADSVLHAGPGALTFPLDFGGMKAEMAMSELFVQIGLEAPSTPLVSEGGPPGHLASENLDPALQSFATAGTEEAGRLCGNISAASLLVPLPSFLINALGMVGCRGYTARNTLLDLIVGGCSVFLVKVIKPTQPDADDTTVAPVGNGPPYSLSADRSTKIVNVCRDAKRKAVDLSSCLDDAAYTAHLEFAARRVIVK